MIEETVNVSQEAGDATLTASPDPLTFIAVGETKVLTIESNTSWTATKDDDADWLTLTASVSLGNGMIDVVASENPTVLDRMAVITITYTHTDGVSMIEETVNVSQEAGDATLTASPDPLTFVAVGETKVLTIESNTSWTATKDDDADWLTLTASVSLGNGMIDVVASENPTVLDRMAVITITYTHTDGVSMIEETVNVSQEAGDATLTASPDPLTFVAVGETKVLTIESNTSWTATKDDDADWLTLTASVSLGNGDINVVATANPTVLDRDGQ